MNLAVSPQIYASDSFTVFVIKLVQFYLCSCLQINPGQAQLPIRRSSQPLSAEARMRITSKIKLCITIVQGWPEIV